MVTVRVIWLSFNEAAMARGYWDQGLIEGLFDGSTWNTPGGPEFVHYEHQARDNEAELYRVAAPGAILVVPARHHADARYVYALKHLLAEMHWALLILTGDESGECHSEWFVGIDRTRLWVMTPQPEREYGNAYLIGSGYPPGIREVLAEADGERHLPWAFLGQITHQRRQACAHMLRDRYDKAKAVLVGSRGFTEGLAQDDYWRTMADAKLAPCPSGPLSADSFRVYEALEAGCVPIADDRHPGPAGQQDYWERIFGADFLPFPTTVAWDESTSLAMDFMLDDWPANANRIFAWWQRQKRAMARRLLDDLCALGALDWDAVPTDPSAVITAIVVTSPTPRHPDIADLEQTIGSIRDQLGDCEIVLVFDGVRPELEHRRDAYEEYTRRALWAANTRWGNVVPVVLDEWTHQARATRKALEQVWSRHVLMVEHDTPLTGEIDWPGIVATLDLAHVDCIRLHHETAIGRPHKHMMLDKEPNETLGPVPLLRTWQWSQRPHVAADAWYRNLLDTYFAPEAKTMIEDVMHGVVVSAFIDDRPRGWEQFRIAVYAPDGDNIQRSLHLDSRRLVVGEEESGDPKGTMIFAYPGETPAGAPAPGER